MKFRDFVGEEIVIKETKKKKKKKKQKVKKQQEQFVFGYGLSKIQLKRMFDYYRSWFIRYNIPYESVNPNLYLYIVSNMPNKNKFVSIVNEIKKPKFYPLGTIEFNKGLYIDYVMDWEFEQDFYKAMNDNNIDIVEQLCYVKILDFENLNQKLMEDMYYSMPKIPYLVLGNPIVIRSQ